MENKIIFYQNQDSNVVINVTYFEDNFWLTQRLIAQLFGVEVPAINKHLNNIFEENELDKEATISKMEIVQQEGNRQVKRQVEFYNLDAIIAVGYRVNSKQATQFRIWATKTLKEYIIKGFVLNDEMLKNGKPFGKDYFNELLERIREIRASERRFFQKLGDIFEQCSADYSKDAEETQLFYKMVQNKLHFAVTGNTAAEIVYNRADRKKDFMGLSTWKNAPKGKILKSDVVVAKNYLNENEIGDLNLLVSAFLDLAEFQARRNQLMNMKDWLDRINKFLESNSLDVLPNAGTVSHEQAVEKAHQEYEHFRVEQDENYLSDLDRELKRLNNK
ncbi:virulence RhuM family protein [Flavobacterium laiguense]|uniref:Cell filamentation protein Fic n=1 Tax=Flavobacterium laiguense TaxID=2169409 RepID=A0A2U1JWL1_9FLAO|nr:virulence RhuM family protein [Flavobacterium laiguense]PWA09375.1 cell filamentation protein Fic [Flavobacterium laiguense]